MQYYAKSKEKSLTIAEKTKLKRDFNDIIESLEYDLTEEEKRALLSIEKNLLKNACDSQKTLKEHLDETTNCAKLFFENYSQYFTEREKLLIMEACRNHDIGKANLLFQMMVNPEIRKFQVKERQIPHGILSALSISRKELKSKYPEITDIDFSILVTAIYYHHTREGKFEDNQIRKYCSTYYEKEAKEFLNQPNWKLLVSNRNNLLFEKNKNVEQVFIDQEVWEKYALVKGMLNKFDWSVSAGELEAEVNSDLEKKILKNNIINIIRKKWGGKFKPVQKFMNEHTNDNLVIVAPTGAGKTEAALLWIDGEKGFYTLPLKVSSNAIYQRIKEQYDYKDISLLHSDSFQIYLEEPRTELEEDAYTKDKKAKLLAAPLTISTVDQLFKFVYKALGTEIFAANLKYSKLVLDEIQSYSPRVIATILYGLKTITRMGGKFAIITATFPPVLGEFMKMYGLEEGREYQMRDFSVESSTKRHKIAIREDEIDIKEIVEQGMKKKVLFICNTVSKAQQLYEEIHNEIDKVYLLHSRFIRRDRNILENEIMNFSKNENASGIWITTQIVEASLDIDFDVLYTEMCPCDSLLQRMGRCNRSERYYPEEANIIVFNNENGIRTIYDPDLYKRSLDYLKQYESIIFTEKMKVDYINQVYDTEKIRETSYYKKIEEFLKYFDEMKVLDYTKEEVDKEFRAIESITVVPDQVYEEYQNIFEKISEFLRRPNIGRNAKSILNSKLNSLTLNMNLFYGKLPIGVDKEVIQNTYIHRANLEYEFDLEKKQGRGLILEKEKDEDCFFA